ncbi:MAG: hypothetical protein AMXMBFR84_24280 [Candidatus Hydrogenedentota bacterium]
MNNDYGIQVLLAFLGWVPVLLLLFVVFPSRRAVIVGFIFAWLFLPVAKYEFEGFVDLDKVTATCLLIFLATLFFDVNRVLTFRPNWVDIPMAVFCLAPLFASVYNGLGLYDGFSEVRNQLFHWAFPYFIGRLYFSELKGMRELAIGIVLGGLVYVPLLLFELRMSPQLHNIVYGFMQHSFLQTMRYGGWRPMVFLEHGLMVGMWMTAATLCAFMFWQMAGIKIVDYAPSFTIGHKLRNIRWPMWTVVALLFAITVLCKSTFAIVLMLTGIGAMLAVKWFRAWYVVPLLSLVIVAYVVVRALGWWDGQELVRVSNAVFGPERAESLAYRLFNENILSARGRQQLVFGWGGWGRSRVDDEWGKEFVTDSSWVIYLGTTGMVGLLSFNLAMLLPALLLRFRIPPKYWTHPNAAPAVLFSILIVLWMLDNTMNNMFNPIFVLMAGGLAGLKRQLVPEDIRIINRAKPGAHAVKRKSRPIPAPASQDRS